MNVVFAAPFLMRATLQFIEGASKLDGVRLFLLTQDKQVPDSLAKRLTGTVRLKNLFDKAELITAMRQLSDRYGRIDRLLGTLEHLQVTLAEVRAELGIPGLDPESANNFREKARMKDVLRAAGLPCALHCLAENPEQAKQFAEKAGFPLVAKPPAGAGSRDTYQINTPEELDQALARTAFAAGKPLLLEEFIMGNEFTFDSAIVNGELVWHSIVRYFPTPLQVLKNPSIQWCLIVPREIDHPHFDDIRAAALKSLNALGLHTGFSHLEWFRRTNGTIAISEVGARPPGGQITSMHGYVHDFDIHKAWAELMVFGRFNRPPRQYAAGCVFLRGAAVGDARRVKAVHGLNRIRKELGPILVEAKLPQIGQPSSGTYEGEGYIILRHPRTDVIERALDRVLATVRVEMG